MDEKENCSECDMPLISLARRILNWPFAMIMAAFGAPVFFCRSCGHCKWPLKTHSDEGAS